MSRRLPPMTAGQFAEIAAGRVIAGDPSRPCARFAFDSRRLVAGEAFLAISGPDRDGHAFLGQALERGATALVVSDETAVAGVAAVVAASGVPVVLVAHTLTALQQAARHVRRASGATVVAITGSAGKTTTKEATATLLSATFRTMRNAGNFNNHLGLPISLMELQDGPDVAVVEFGMNHAGEIRTLLGVAEPDVRVWTNVGTAHIGHFDSQDDLAAAKAEILESATSDTIAVTNADDPLVAGHVRGFPGRSITFGVDADADVRATRVEDRGLEGQRAEVRTPAGPVSIEFPLAGRVNLENVLAAVAVAVSLGVPLDTIAAQATRLRPAESRGELLRLARNVLVYDDGYNASPSAMTRTLQLIGGDRSGRRRVAFLGEMLELGASSEELHRGCGREAAKAGLAALVTVGGEPARALGEAAVLAGLDGGVVHHAPASREAAALVPGLVREGDLVLVKGSHGIGMGRVVERLRVEFA